MEILVIPVGKLDLKAVRGIQAILYPLVPAVCIYAIASEILGHNVTSVISILAGMGLASIGIWLNVREWTLLNNSSQISKESQNPAPLSS